MKIWLESRSDWFVLPVFKSQMVYLLTGWYPKDEAKFKRMSCRQLRAIICEIVKRQNKKKEEYVQVDQGVFSVVPR